MVFIKSCSFVAGFFPDSEMTWGIVNFGRFYNFNVFVIELLMFIVICLNAVKSAACKSGLHFMWLYFLVGGVSQPTSSGNGSMQSQCSDCTAIPFARAVMKTQSFSGNQATKITDTKTDWPKKKKKKSPKKKLTSETFFSETFTPKHPARSRRKSTTVELSTSVSFVASVFNKDSREQLTGIGLEVYQQQNDRIESLLTKRTFGHGIILSTLNLDFNHRLVITKPGFHRTEVIITREEMRGLRLLKKEFELHPDVSVHSIALPMMPDEIQDERSDDPFPGTEGLPTIAVIIPADTVTERNSANKDKPRVFVVYEVLQNSVIRQEPNEAAALLLSVQKGSRLELLEKTNALWYKVRFRDFVGFLPTRMLRPEK